MLHTTLDLLRQHDACRNGYRKLLRYLGGGAAWPSDRPIPLTTVLFANDITDAVWCLRAVLPAEEAARDRVARLFAADCAEAVLPLFEHVCPNDDRPRLAIAAARAFARGEIDAATMKAAMIAAKDAALETMRRGADITDELAAYDAAAVAMVAASDDVVYAAWAATCEDSMARVTHRHATLLRRRLTETNQEDAR